METKFNLSNVEQKEFSKLTDDETIVTKAADKGGPVVIISTDHYQSMIMQHLLNENTHQMLDSYINSKIQNDLLRFLKNYKMCFTKPEWKFLNDKHHKVSNFYGLPKIYKSMVIESTINNQNSEIIEIFEPNDLKLRPIVSSPNCARSLLSHFIDKLLKPLLKRIKNFIRDSLDFLNKCPRDVVEKTQIVTFGVISLHTSILRQFGLEAIDYFLTRY